MAIKTTEDLEHWQAHMMWRFQSEYVFDKKGKHYKWDEALFFEVCNRVGDHAYIDIAIDFIKHKVIHPIVEQTAEQWEMGVFPDWFDYERTMNAAKRPK